MRHLALVALLLATSAFAQVSGKPRGTNCDLTKPPDAAGEVTNHGATMRIFPRARDIGPGYTGCQLMFAPDKDRWVVVSAAEVVDGDPVRIWSEFVEGSKEMLECRYSKRKVVRGDANNCPMPEFLLIPSMRAGCVEKVRKVAGTSDRLAPGEGECKYE